MKPSIKIGNITFTSENPTSGFKEAVTLEGIEVQCELSIPELVELHKDGAVMGDRILRFIRSELPDTIRNCGRAVEEIRELQQKQKLVHKEQKILLKQRLKAQKKAEESDPKA